MLVSYLNRFIMYTNMKIINIQSQLAFYTDYNALEDPLILQLCLESIRAMSHAYAPYSNYQVGAAVLLSDDTILQGSNQENAVYPLGLCAERVALFSVSALHPDHHVKALAVTTKKELSDGELPPFPCGSCRQVILEIEQRQSSPITIYVVGANSSVCVVEGVGNLLPFSFDQDSL